MKKLFKNKKAVLILGIILLLLLALLLAKPIMGLFREDPQPPQTDISDTNPPVAEQTDPEDTEPQIIPHMAEKQAQNPDFAAWIKIDGTVLDYPVMYTPEDREKYLHRDFEQRYSFSGLPFFDSNCTLDPESDNLIIYGHNMGNGTMFRTLMSYTDQQFWKEHPQVQLTTLYEDRTYDIVAVFYDRVYYKYENVFKFYQFIDAENEEDFNEAIAYYKEHALYDTGITPEYGDRLLTLVTCAYHETNGRFVVIARQTVD